MSEEIRINKYLSDAGLCSRREADTLIAAQRVIIRNGEEEHLASPGEKVQTGRNTEVLVDGERIFLIKEMVYLLYNKPRGVECTANRSVKNNIIDAVGYEGYVSYVGRLDKDSRGLILLTNDGVLGNALMRAVNQHEREYWVRVHRLVTEDFIQKMSSGVEILGTVTRPCTVTQTGEHTFRIILTQGLNRQIRRMCLALGYVVKDLKRIRIENLTLDGVPEGSYRFLTKEEVDLLRGSCGLPHLMVPVRGEKLERKNNPSSQLHFLKERKTHG